MTIKYKFRFAFTPDWSGADNMQIDRILGEESPPDLPFLRFYTWAKPTISIGCNQIIARRINLELCRLDNIPVVKRPTGGRELLHGHDLCYTAAIPLTKRLGAVEARGYFAEISSVLTGALQAMGVKAQWLPFSGRPRLSDGPCFIQADSGEISVAGRKLMASAQRVFEGCLIQQGSMPLFKPKIDLTGYLNCGAGDDIRRRIEEVATNFAEVSPETPTLDDLVSNFRKAFENFYGASAGPAEDILDEFQRNNFRA
ncbi:MAG: hypothetical protein A2W25_09130 [candidate division Zixibacteria bacterium RBG_16_53_22]|nr:MAG: hypothetical protein A2W25_09130 [candidate division Zixibacteria bacterium RBG_16_53_22]